MSKSPNVNCLHLEVFANEDFKTFVQTAQIGDKRLPQSFNWATILDAQSSRDHVSIFENLEAQIKIKMYLVKGNKVEIIEEKDDWLYILYKGKKDIKAWIAKSAVA
ncbi:MAG: hypothetical protein PHG81_11280 [Aliarcobacter sp.]|nr:hypothetical protein [Aliarcobacter sp.]